MNIAGKLGFSKELEKTLQILLKFTRNPSVKLFEIKRKIGILKIGHGKDIIKKQKQKQKQNISYLNVIISLIKSNCTFTYTALKTHNILVKQMIIIKRGSCDYTGVFFFFVFLLPKSYTEESCDNAFKFLTPLRFF